MNQRDQDGLAAALQPILNELTTSGISRRKQEGTILGIAARYAVGEGYDTPEFWKQPAVASRTTFHKWRKQDPVFVDALEAAKTAVSSWNTERAGAAVEDALLRLQLATPDFVDTVIDLAQTAENEHTRLQGAFGGLDRAVKLVELRNTLMRLLIEEVDLTQLSDEQIHNIEKAKNAKEILRVVMNG